MDEYSDKTIAGRAALSICESTLIALHELGIINGTQERELLEDAAETHRIAITAQPELAEMHRAVSAAIRGLIERRMPAWQLLKAN